MSDQRTPKPKIDILHHDATLVVVNKPPGVLSVPGRGGEPGLAEVLRAARRIDAGDALRSVHRLDRDASGVIVFARTIEAERHLTRQFEQREVEKTYLALVQGRIDGQGEIDQPLAVSDDGLRASVDERRGKPAVTRYQALEHFIADTLVECRPLTGRLHQIRVHLAALGHPLTVDPLYGGGTEVRLSDRKPGYRPSGRHEERPLIARLTLHAAAIAFRHPDDERAVRFEAEMPKDFRATLSQLRKLL